MSLVSFTTKAIATDVCLTVVAPRNFVITFFVVDKQMAIVYNNQSQHHSKYWRSCSICVPPGTPRQQAGNQQKVYWEWSVSCESVSSNPGDHGYKFRAHIVPNGTDRNHTILRMWPATGVFSCLLLKNIFKKFEVEDSGTSQLRPPTGLAEMVLITRWSNANIFHAEIGVFQYFKTKYLIKMVG